MSAPIHSEPSPHTYRQQRVYEKEAARNRDGMLSKGTMNLPTICGYTYKVRPTTKQRVDPNWTTKDVVCMRTSGAGTKHLGNGFCDYHEWAAKQETDKATKPRNELTYAMKQAAERSRFFGDPRLVDPHSTLLEEISRSASIVQFYEKKLQEMREVNGWNDNKIMTQTTLKDGVKPSVWMDLFNSERDHLVKTCIAAIKAGVAERKVQIAEQQGRLIAAMLFAFMHDPDLALSPDQIIKAPQIIRKHMLSLPQQNPAAVDPARVLASTPQPIETSARER